MNTAPGTGRKRRSSPNHHRSRTTAQTLPLVGIPITSPGTACPRPPHPTTTAARSAPTVESHAKNWETASGTSL